MLRVARSALALAPYLGYLAPTLAPRLALYARNYTRNILGFCLDFKDFARNLLGTTKEVLGFDLAFDLILDWI